MSDTKTEDKPDTEDAPKRKAKRLTRDERREVVEKLAAESGTGTVTADALVEAAQDPAHPMHDHFEWDDAKAAHAHRLQTARGILASVAVATTVTNPVTSEPVVVTVPMVVSPVEGRAHGGGYKLTGETNLDGEWVMSAEGEAHLREEAAAALRAAAKRYGLILSVTGTAGLLGDIIGLVEPDPEPSET